MEEFLKCPHRWYLHRVKKLDGTNLLAGPAGSAFHKMTEDYDNRCMPDEYNKYSDYLDAELELDVAYTSIRDENYNWWVVNGQLMFEAYKKWRADVPWEVVGIEEEVLVQPEPLTLPFLGYVDRRFRLSDGRIVLVDIKTGFRMPTRSPQLGEYQAASRILGRQVDVVTYYNARTGKTTGLETLDEWTPEKLVEHVLPVETAILADEFPPNPSASLCRYCPVREHCEFRAGKK